MVRNMRTLNGRRVRLSDLIEADLLADGEELSLSVGDRVATGVIRDPGRLRLSSGQEFQTPSPAAAAAVGATSLDGWNYWRKKDGRTLDVLRQELLDREASEVTTDEPREPGTLSPEGRAWLKAVRERAFAGEPTTITVRELLAHWRLERRDGVETNHVIEALEERRLQATPSVTAAALDSEISLSAMPQRVEKGRIQAKRADQGTDLGLTLDNLLDKSRPLVSVGPQDSLAKARTLMRMNGYSQLPVLNGMTLKGAVTWQSIAEALCDGVDSQVHEAMVPAEAYPADRHLLEVIGSISSLGFVIVLGRGGPMGIVTHSDVADAFVDLATPFALIGDLDRRLRAVLDETLEWEFLRDAIDPRHSRKLPGIDRLTFGDYVAAFRAEEVWSQLGWWVDQSVFVKQLDELRLVRNNVTHFNPDPPRPDDVEKLRLLNGLLIELTGS